MLLRSIFLLCALPLLTGCILGAAIRYATPDADCEALRSDQERGAVTTARRDQKKCDQIKQEKVEEARPKVQPESAPNLPEEQR